MKNVFMIWKTWSSKVFSMILIGFLVTGLSFNSYGQSWNEVVHATASNKNSQDSYGFSVDIFGDFAIVGAPNDYVSGHVLAGSAYILKRQNNTWTEVQRINQQVIDDYDQFGYSVAIYQDIIIVGAIEDNSPLNSGQFSTKAGSAYVFKKQQNGTWAQHQKLTLGLVGCGEDLFGRTVDIYGEDIMIGAGEECVYNYQGSVYYFKKQSNGFWSQIQKIKSLDIANYDRFGISFALFEDKLIVGAPNESPGVTRAGSAYYFEKQTNGMWTQKQKLFAPDRAYQDRYGISVDLYGDQAIIGAHVDDHSGVNDAGSAYIYELSSNGYFGLSQKILPNNPIFGARFGRSVSLDGEFVVLGAYDSDHSEIFKKVNGNWNYIQDLNSNSIQHSERFGYAVALHENKIIIGAFEDNPVGLTNAGSAFIYETCFAPEINQTTQTLYVCAGDNLTIEPNLSGSDLTYKWRKQIGTILYKTVIGTNGTYTINNASSSNEFKYHLTINNSCGSDASVIAEVIIGPPPGGAPCSHSKKGSFNDISELQIFPNPANDRLSIKASSNIHSLKIVNELGQSKNIPVDRNSLQSIDLSGFASGMYFLEIQTETERSIEKVIIQH